MITQICCPHCKKFFFIDEQFLGQDVRCGSDSEFRVLMTLTIKAGMPRNRTGIGRRLKTTHAENRQTEETSMHKDH